MPRMARRLGVEPVMTPAIRESVDERIAYLIDDVAASSIEGVPTYERRRELVDLGVKTGAYQEAMIKALGLELPENRE
jgi:hypothetical protein